MAKTKFYEYSNSRLTKRNHSKTTIKQILKQKKTTLSLEYEFGHYNYKLMNCGSQENKLLKCNNIQKNQGTLGSPIAYH